MVDVLFKVPRVIHMVRKELVVLVVMDPKVGTIDFLIVVYVEVDRIVGSLQVKGNIPVT